MIKIDVRGIKNLKVKFGKLTQFMTMRVPAVSHEEADKGAMFARNIAPYLTGALYQGIDVGTTGRGTKYAVVSRTPKNKDGRYRPYHLYMHGLGGRDTSKFIKSGDPHYMFKVYNMLKESYPKRIVEELRKTIKG